jgi:predicted Zn-dependent protease
VPDSPRIEELKRRVQSDPASIAFAALAEEYRRGERFQEAIDTCTAGLVRHPSYLSAHVTLGRALIEVGRLKDARHELEYVLKLAPENLAAIRGLAEIHHRTGEEAADHYHHEEPDPSAASDDAAAIAEIQAASGHPAAVAQEAQQDEVHIPVTAAAESTVVTNAQSAMAAVQVPSEVPSEHPALAGLEELLNAILRARANRVAAR